jgi:hypothetical protein
MTLRRHVGLKKIAGLVNQALALRIQPLKPLTS